jgi:hypothetical protein
MNSCMTITKETNSVGIIMIITVIFCRNNCPNLCEYIKWPYRRRWRSTTSHVHKRSGPHVWKTGHTCVPRNIFISGDYLVLIPLVFAKSLTEVNKLFQTWNFKSVAVCLKFDVQLTQTVAIFCIYSLVYHHDSRSVILNTTSGQHIFPFTT